MCRPCSRALCYCVLSMSACLGAWCAYLLAFLACLRVHVLTSFMFLRAHMSYMLAVLRYFTCLRASLTSSVLHFFFIRTRWSWLSLSVLIVFPNFRLICSYFVLVTIIIFDLALHICIFIIHAERCFDGSISESINKLHGFRLLVWKWLIWRKNFIL